MIVKINTHPIVKEIHEEYSMNWCGKIVDADPKIKNGFPVFMIRGSIGSVSLNTVDMNYIEKIAKKLTAPKGRASITTDKIYVYLVQKDNSEILMGVLTHNHVKTYNQMFDSFEYV